MFRFDELHVSISRGITRVIKSIGHRTCVTLGKVCSVSNKYMCFSLFQTWPDFDELEESSKPGHLVCYLVACELDHQSSAPGLYLLVVLSATVSGHDRSVSTVTIIN